MPQTLAPDAPSAALAADPQPSGSVARGAVPTELRRHSQENPWTYALLDRRQREIADRVRAGGPGALLLSEVAPVVTLGRRASGPAPTETPKGGPDLLLTPEELARQGVEVLSVDRGGLATWHGPGQWVAFAVDSLERLTGDSRGVRRAVEGLLEAAHRVARQSAPGAEIRSGLETGVWIPGRGKVASVGVHIERGVLLHGLSLNVAPTPLSFRGIRACGLDAAPAFLGGHFLSIGSELDVAIRAHLWRV